MAKFDRFDICEAYCLLESDYNVGGILQERPSNQRRNESTGVQLARMGYYGGMVSSGIEDAEDNVKEIYYSKVLEWGLPIDDELKEFMTDFFVPEYLNETRPEIFNLPVNKP